VGTTSDTKEAHRQDHFKVTVESGEPGNRSYHLTCDGSSDVDRIAKNAFKNTYILLWVP
jgi:hypothetical protein